MVGGNVVGNRLAISKNAEYVFLIGQAAGSVDGQAYKSGTDVVV